MARKPPPTWKLTYFDGRGRAEILRLILAYNGRKYIDNRISFEEWATIQSSTPFGALPVLEINGCMYAQAIAVAQFLARESGLYTKNSLDTLTIDQILLAREDILVPEAKIKFEKDKAKQKEFLDEYIENLYPKYFTYFNNLIKKNPAKSGFAIGKNITLADISIFDMTEWVTSVRKNVLDQYPEIKTLRAKVAAVKGIKQYLEQRKDSPF